MASKPKILFVYDHPKPEMWKDGLWAALELLKDKFEITFYNLRTDFDENGVGKPVWGAKYDFILGWGAFNSPVDRYLQNPNNLPPKGLCVAGTPLSDIATYYRVLFYETEWYGKQLDHPNKIHAFGVNAQTYFPKPSEKIFNYLTVGSFSTWKRQDKFKDKLGIRLAVGEIQRGNLSESLSIIMDLLEDGVMVSDMVRPDVLAKLYRASDQVYIPADVNGGGERAVLEARACGTPVEVESDNPKLQELLTSPVFDHHYYAKQLEKGIRSVL